MAHSCSVMDPIREADAMTADLPPIEGITCVDHVGLAVPDLMQARTFLVDVLGCEYMYTLGPYQDTGSWMSEHLNVDDRAVMRELQGFRLGGQAIFEVFQYEEAGQRWVYFLSPWGMQFELVSYPHGKAFNRNLTDESAASAGEEVDSE